MRKKIFTKIIQLFSFISLFIIFSFAHAAVCTYDSLNRLTSVQYPNGHLIEYDYDANGNMTAMRYVTPADSDGDGLTDTWEQQIIDADPNDGINTFSDVLATADFDGDGVDNGIEFNFNTDPTDILSPAAGDLNIDNDLTLYDAILALKVVTGSDDGSAVGAGILDGEKKIGIDEAIYILQKVSGIR